MAPPPRKKRKTPAPKSRGKRTTPKGAGPSTSGTGGADLSQLKRARRAIEESGENATMSLRMEAAGLVDRLAAGLTKEQYKRSLANMTLSALVRIDVDQRPVRKIQFEQLPAPVNPPRLRYTGNVEETWKHWEKRTGQKKPTVRFRYKPPPRLKNKKTGEFSETLAAYKRRVPSLLRSRRFVAARTVNTVLAREKYERTLEWIQSNFTLGGKVVDRKTAAVIARLLKDKTNLNNTWWDEITGRLVYVRTVDPDEHEEDSETEE